ILAERFCVIGKFRELYYNRTKNPVSQDSPPAAGCICDLFLFRRSAILAERFCVIGKFRELYYNTKKEPFSGSIFKWRYFTIAKIP
ncbi:MAG: hypothetical protein ACLSEX_15055, partial [Blautia sp.]